jgi:inner membrane protein
METNRNLEQKLRSVNIQLTLKVIIIGIIALALLIPKMMIIGLIQERETTAEAAKHEVMEKWSLSQNIRGPILTIPYIERTADGNDVIREQIRECHFLPETLAIDGEIIPQELYRSIYQSVVYESSLEITGNFKSPDFGSLKINPSDVLWEKAKLSLAISDLRGINATTDLSWNGNTYPFSPGMDNKVLGNNGISLSLPTPGGSGFPAKFQINLKLKGSDAIQFAPLGETTEVSLQSTWNDPGFQGNFLPAEREVGANGFTANWKVLNYNRNFPQQWKGNDFTVANADFGVKLVTVADHYQKNYRSAKYGILVILFMFLSFFLNEIITKQRIHPFQYILVGFAILIFYLLLLSISEQMGFNYAYLISALSVTGLVLAYSRTFLKTWLNSIMLTSILIFSFGFIFILMQLESYALLAGSIGLFFVLAMTMFFTRKINWYGE